MQHLEVSGAVRHIYIYIYIYVITRLKVNLPGTLWATSACCGRPLLASINANISFCPVLSSALQRSADQNKARFCHIIQIWEFINIFLKIS